MFPQTNVLSCNTTGDMNESPVMLCYYYDVLLSYPVKFKLSNEKSALFTTRYPFVIF